MPITKSLTHYVTGNLVTIIRKLARIALACKVKITDSPVAIMDKSLMCLYLSFSSLLFERRLSRLDLNGHEHSTARGVPFTCSSEHSVVSPPQTDEKCILEIVLLTVACLTSISKLLYLQWDACTCLLVKKNNWNRRLRWFWLHIDLVFLIGMEKFAVFSLIVTAAAMASVTL